jgi:glycosyltransferase involved in cell wall biosynthesis
MLDGKPQEVKYKNVFYFADINAIGGVETMFWNLARKYGKSHDILILYRTADPAQLERLSKLVHVKKYYGQHIKCERAFFNFNTDPIETIEADEYSVILHSDYHARKIYPPEHRKITRYIGVSNHVSATAHDISGHTVETCYNPIIVDKPRKVLHLVSATRLTVEKGKNRMKKLADALTNAGIPFIWTVFTNDLVPIDNPNVIYMKPCLTVTDYIADADYLVQLSDTEGYSYTILEALCLGTPIITTPCPVYKEMGLAPENSFIIPFDMNAIPVDAIYKGLKKWFKYTPPDDRWDELLAPGKSNYDDVMGVPVTIRITRISWPATERRTSARLQPRIYQITLPQQKRRVTAPP